jgi:hypothetical protein
VRDPRGSIKIKSVFHAWERPSTSKHKLCMDLLAKFYREKKKRRMEAVESIIERS